MPEPEVLYFNGIPDQLREPVQSSKELLDLLWRHARPMIDGSLPIAGSNGASFFPGTEANFYVGHLYLRDIQILAAEEWRSGMSCEDIRFVLVPDDAWDKYGNRYSQAPDGSEPFGVFVTLG